MRRALLLVSVLLMALSLTVVLPARPAVAATLAAGFSDTTLAAVTRPTAVAPTADGRVLVTSQTGQLWVIRDGVTGATPALDLAAAGVLCSNYERGLLGVATDPASSAVFLFYTARDAADTAGECPRSTGGQAPRSPRNRVSRFLLGADDRIVPGSETVLLQGIPSSSGYHNAGDLHLGKDGMLYVSTGDGMCDHAGDSGCGLANDAARSRNALQGSIIRITTAGGVPADNPFASGAGTASCRTGPVAAGLTCRELYASGLRNPFRMAFDPDAPGTVFRIHDVGQDLWEEIDQGTPGADYGWNVREGLCPAGAQMPCSPAPPGLTDPVYSYPHSSGCASITGGAYVPDGAGWPAALADHYLYADYVCGAIVALSPSGTRTDLATGLGSGSAVAMAFGPQFGPNGGGGPAQPGRQALYYTTYLGGGQLHAITATGTANRVPTAVLTASVTAGVAPLAVTLDGSGGSDPDGQALTYRWDAGDGSPVVTGPEPSLQHTYRAGNWTASLTVTDPGGATSAAATVLIRSGNTAPTVRILAPAAGDLFTTGVFSPLRGEATDPQDGRLPDSALSWTVIKHHNTHTHPVLGPETGNLLSVQGPGPEDLSSTRNSWLEIQLTATDSQGSTTTVSQEFRPRLVPVTVNTEPAGRRVLVNGESITGGTTIVSWAGADLDVSVPAQTDAAGRPYAFDRWSDGGANAHTVVTPATTLSLTATTSLRGLQGSYFDGPAFTGTRLDRLDPAVGFDWGAGSPAPSMGADTYSARWRGQVQAPVTGTYTFSTVSDDGVRLWVGGRLLVDQWNDHARRTDGATITLTAGVRYPVTMEYYEAAGAAVAQLRWAYPGQTARTVPTDALFPRYAVTFRPAASPAVPGWSTDSGAAFGPRSGLEYGWNAPVVVRDRGTADPPDERYDTLALMQQPPNPAARWDLALPSGSYAVRVVAGDPSWTDSVYALTAEGIPVVTGRASTAARWLDQTAVVPVTDGRLTLTNGTGARNSKITFVEVSLR